MQSWNWPAIKRCAYLIQNPKVMIPKLSYKRIVGVSDIDWNVLREDHGIQGICFDKDNTITSPYSEAIHFSALESVEKCKHIFGNRVAVFSNSIGSSQFDPNFDKARRFSKNTGLNVIEHNSKKPEGAEYIINYFKNIKPHQIALVGDRILTDTVMANDSGLVSILITDPLTIQGDNIPALVIRFLEQNFLKLIEKNKK